MMAAASTFGVADREAEQVVLDPGGVPEFGHPLLHSRVTLR